MKKNIVFALLAVVFFAQLAAAQAGDEEETGSGSGFKKEKLFSGGSIALSFFNNTFLVGASPVLGYSLTHWADAGLVANINYSSTRDYGGVFNAKLRQTIYGGGAFVRLFPVQFLFAQAQVEHNFINTKYLPPNNNSGLITQKNSTSVNSVLVGAGYTQGRQMGGSSFFYLSVLFDVSGNKNSPYTDNYGRSIPIIRAGFHVPLFQGR
jgi:hypothetical protein